MVGADQGNLRSSVFFVWGGLCTCAFVYSYFLIPETKVRSLKPMTEYAIANSLSRVCLSSKSIG